MNIDLQIQDLVKRVQEEGLENLTNRILSYRKWAGETLKDLERSINNGGDLTSDDRNKAILAVSKAVEAIDTSLALVRHDLLINIDTVNRLRMGVVLQGTGIHTIISKLHEKGLLDETEVVKAWEDNYAHEMQRLQQLPEEVECRDTECKDDHDGR